MNTNRSAQFQRTIRAAAVAASAGLALTASHAAADVVFFNFNDFADTTAFNLVDSAHQVDTAISVTPLAGWKKGAVWLDQRVSLIGNFTTEFQFRTSNKQGLGADGFAFVIQDYSADAIGGSGGAMGYGTNPFTGEFGIPRSLAVEFDMWDNERDGPGIDWPDLPANHVSIQSAGTNPNHASHVYSLGAAELGVDLTDGQIHILRVEYAAPPGAGVDGVLNVFVNDVLVVTAELNIMDLLDLNPLDGGAWVGFTSATGREIDAMELQVLSWSGGFIPTPGAIGLLAIAGAFAARRRRA